MIARGATQRKKNKAIDWDEVRQRVESAGAAVERVLAPDAVEARLILKARAQALARRPDTAETGNTLECVEFLLAHERYAVETRHVREVHPLENLTPLPCTPAFVLGIVNLRGEILSVVDIRKFFDLPERGLTDLNKVIVLRSEVMLFGILADAVLGVRRIPVVEIQSSLPTLTGIRDRYLRGVTPERTVVLDAQRLLTDDAVIVQDQA